MKLPSIFLLTVLGVAAVQAEVVVESPWVREAPPTVKLLASYMVLRNTGDTVQILKGATATGFEHVEIHRTTINNGVAAMEAQDSLSIPAHASLSLAPGSYHLMLMMGHHPLKDGDIVDLSLSFNDGKTIAVRAPIRKDPTTTEDHSNHQLNHNPAEHHHP